MKKIEKRTDLTRKEKLARQARKIRIRQRHRKKNPLSSFAFRISAILMVVLVSAIFILSVLFFHFIYLSNSESQNRELKLANGVLRGSIVTKDDVFFIPYYISYIVYDVESHDVIMTNNPFLPLLSETPKKAKRYLAKNYFSDGDLDILYYAQPIKIEELTLMVVTAENMDYDKRNTNSESYPFIIIFIFGILVIISFWFTFLTARQTIRPVIKITKAAKNISSSNLDDKLPTGKFNDEIDDLANTFNALFKRLKLDFDREKQFSSDVSHELKTPLAVIIGQTNLLLRWGKDSPEQLEKSLIAIKDEAKSMEVIINNLLEITRIENGIIKPRKDEFNVFDLFMRLKNEFLQIAPKCVIEIYSDENLTMKNDIEMLHQVLTVSMSNSIKFATDECKIILSAQKVFDDAENEKIIISAQDNGPGFGAKNIAHVFDRFYCGDEARNRSKGGFGLGLSIAKVLVAAMGGKISAEDVENSGTEHDKYNSQDNHGAIIKIEFDEN